MKYDGEAGARRVTIKSLSAACSCTVGKASAALAETMKDRVRAKAELVDRRPRTARGTLESSPRVKWGERHKSGERIEAIALIQVLFGGEGRQTREGDAIINVGCCGLG